MLLGRSGASQRITLLILDALFVRRGKQFWVQAQPLGEKFGIRATVRDANIHVEVPTNMNKSTVAFQPAPKLFPQHLSNHITNCL
jgi:hypothetical protein